MFLYLVARPYEWAHIWIEQTNSLVKNYFVHNELNLKMGQEKNM